MSQIEIVLGLLVAVAVLATVARKIDVPYPILLVVGGLALGFVPWLPTVQLDPNLVFLLFLPPLLYWESLNISYRDFRDNLSSIALLATGLVVATTVVVAVVAHAVTALSWPAAFVLGAIVSPTDAVAATAIARRFNLPRTIVTVVEGESLVNDAMALVLYAVAVAAAGRGFNVSIARTAAQFVLIAAGGIAIGLSVGWAIAWLRRRLNDPPVENTVSLLTGFAAYLPANAVHASGVLAVVATGLYLGRQGPRIVSARTRLQAQQMWEVIVFLLNGLIFILIGLQLHAILTRLSGMPAIDLLRDALAVSLVVILVRLIWMRPGAYIARRLDPRRRHEPMPSWQGSVIVAWSGMGGVVSLAAALALPAAFPGRDLIVFLTFSVILATLAGKGLTLPWLIRRLGITGDGLDDREEAKARYKASQAALARLETLAAEDWVPRHKAERLRSQYQYRSHVLSARFDGHDDEEHDHVTEAETYQRLRREVVLTERQTVVKLRDTGVINDDVLHRIQRELDLEELQLSDSE